MQCEEDVDVLQEVLSLSKSRLPVVAMSLRNSALNAVHAAWHLNHCCASFADFYSAQDFDDWLQGKYQGVPLNPAAGQQALEASCMHCIWLYQKFGIVLLILVLCLCGAEPKYAAGSKVNPAGPIIWVIHAVGILAMVSFG